MARGTGSADMQAVEQGPAGGDYDSEASNASAHPGMGQWHGTMADAEPCGMMGAGMPGGCGMGMGQGMMGPGMMGPGMGSGMTPHHGGMMGPGGGMMRGYAMGPIMHLDLTDSQRTQINKISDGLRQQHWAAMGKIMEQQSKLRDLYATDQPDPKQVGDTYGTIAKLRQDMVVAQVKAHNDALGVLTNEQRDQLKRMQRGGWGVTGGPQGQGQTQPMMTPPPPPSQPPPPR